MRRTASALRVTALIIICTLGFLLPTLLACSQTSADSDTTSSASEEGSTSSASAEASSSASASEPSSTGWAYEGKDAAYILDSLKSKGLSIGETEVYDETTDPNGSLGQEGSYTSKATFVDSRFDAKEAHRESSLSRDFGGTLEVFESEEDCIARQGEISDTVDSTGGVGDMYVYRYGKALLRIGCELDPDQAAEYMDAFLEGADKARCSKTGMAADGYTPLEKTGKTTELDGIVFSVGEGWSIGNPVGGDGYTMTYLQKGTYYAQQCYIGKLEGDTSTSETTEQVLQMMLAETGDSSDEQAVDIDGVTAWRGSAKSYDPEITWHYTVIPVGVDFVIACYYVTDEAPANAFSDFEKSLHLSADNKGAEATKNNSDGKEEKSKEAEANENSSDAKEKRDEKAESEEKKDTKTDKSNKAESVNPPLEESFPVDNARKAATVALTNSLADDVFASDRNSHDPALYHSFSDRSGFYLELKEDGTWTEKDSSTWHVENIRYGVFEFTTEVKASLDVRFDGSNYIVSNITGIEAIPGKESYGTDLTYIEEWQPEGFEALTVPPSLLE